jgi:hypothetical protein
MRSRNIVLSLGALGLAAAVVFGVQRSAAQATAYKLDATKTLGAPVTYKNLTIIPVYDSSARATNNYATLDEALSAKTIKVRESQGGGTVNTLYIKNTGKKPVYLMAGEIVLGGQQDRCVGHDVIVRPSKKEVPVTVFCVEHGRWSGQSEFAGAAKMVAANSIRADAQEGAFAGSRPAAEVSAQIAVNGQSRLSRANREQTIEIGSRASVGGAQQKVWDKVAAKNVRFKEAPATGTYRSIANMEGREAQKVVGPYVKALSGGLATSDKLVGAVAAINGEVVSADVFGDPTLFAKLWPKLLKSYAADAAEASTARSNKKPVTPQIAGDFIKSAGQNAKKAENRSDVGATLRLESKSAVSYQLSAPAMAGGAAAGGKVLHQNVLSKPK